MKLFTKIAAVLLVVLFLLSLFANSALADPDSISVTSKWTANNSAQVSVTSGNDAELFVYASSTSNFRLWIDVYDGSTVVKSVINNLFVPANTQSTYFQKFIIKTDGLGTAAGKKYTVRVHVMNTNTGQSKNAFLDLTVTKKYSFPWRPVPTNDAPTISGIDNFVVYEGSTLQFNVYGWDTDNDDLTFEGQVCTVIVLGEICISSPLSQVGAVLETKTAFGIEYGVFKWTPAYHFIQHPAVTKNTKFRFRSYDGKAYSAWEYSDILVKDTNRLPSFNPVGDKVVYEGQTLTISLIGHDLDHDELMYKYVGDTLPGAHLSKTSKYKALLTWKPGFTAAAHSPYDITIIVADGFGGQRQEHITIVVLDTPVQQNYDITARDVAVDVDEDLPVIVAMVCVGGEGTLTHAIVAGPSHGVLSSVVGNEVVYTPDENYNGADSFTYQCTDTAGRESNIATVSIGIAPVNDNPVAIDDSAQTLENTAVVIDVLANDSDVDGDSLSLDYVGAAGNGIAVITTVDGFSMVEYTPNLGFIGIDHFRYHLHDGNGGDDWATVTITVNQEVPPPVPQCSDGVDNDGDGLIDYGSNLDNDPGCQTSDDDDESDDPAHFPQCFDGLDNDGDGLVDYGSDPGCDSVNDEDEFNEIVDEPVSQCSDGLDNDNDSLIDYGQNQDNDPGCESAEDNDEFNVVEVPEEPQLPYTNVKFKSIHFTEDQTVIGGYTYLSVHMVNDGNHDLEGLRVTARIYALGAAGSSGKFDLEQGQDTGKKVYIPMPSSVPPGLYLVKITVKNDHYHDTAYRILSLY